MKMSMNKFPVKGGLVASTGIVSALTLSIGMLVASTDQAAAQESCSQYSVVRGDTLSEIARSARVSGGYQILFNANRSVLDSPNLLEVGQVLTIPCADGSLPGATAASTRTVTAPEAKPTSQPNRPLRIVTASGYAPFTDEDLPGGGFFTQLVDRSVRLGAPDQEFDLFFVNDWGSQLESLLPSGAIDMAFPWYKPDCSKVDNLSAANAFRCTDFNHSEPFYDALVGYYTLTGSAYENADSYDDLFGARLCRPTDWFTFDLEGEQLIEPNITLVRAATQIGCWEMLDAGEVDVVTYDALPAEEDYTEGGYAENVVTLDALASKQTLHVFVSKDNAFANEALPIINAGLEQLRLSGEWFSIVSAGITETIQN